MPQLLACWGGDGGAPPHAMEGWPGTVAFGQFYSRLYNMNRRTLSPRAAAGPRKEFCIRTTLFGSATAPRASAAAPLLPPRCSPAVRGLHYLARAHIFLRACTQHTHQASTSALRSAAAHRDAALGAAAARVYCREAWDSCTITDFNPIVVYVDFSIHLADAYFLANRELDPDIELHNNTLSLARAVHDCAVPQLLDNIILPAGRLPRARRRCPRRRCGLVGAVHAVGRGRRGHRRLGEPGQGIRRLRLRCAARVRR